MLSSQVARVRHYWWLVLVIVVVSMIGAIAATMTTPTTYTGRASLIVSSNDRSPDQDAVLVQGYADYFNDVAYQSKLLAEKEGYAAVTVTARAAAGSPILLIDATAHDADTAQSAAAAVAVAFQADINKVHKDENETEVASLQLQLDRHLARVSANSPDSPPEALITSLQDQILKIRSDRVNMLQQLQLNGGVSQDAPRLSLNLLFALNGGLIMGVLAALVVGSLSNRLGTRRDLLDKVGLNALIEIPKARNRAGAKQRQLRMRQLANMVKDDLSQPAVVAVTQPRNGAGSAMVAWGLARQWAEQGRPTLLVRAAENPGSWLGRTEGTRGGSDGPHQVEFPTDAAVLNSLTVSGPVHGMRVLMPGRSPDGVQERFEASMIHEFLAQAASLAEFIIIEAGPVVDSINAQDLCAAAGRTLLVVEMSVSRVAEVTEAVSILEQTKSGLLGAVLVQSAGPDSRDFDTRGGPRKGSGPHDVAPIQPVQTLSFLERHEG
jgi:Mrp family chromosome partitioning ATPase/capsular polysaccharide biosynthesis protein